jgi:hypothetical protein
MNVITKQQLLHISPLTEQNLYLSIGELRHAKEGIVW